LRQKKTAAILHFHANIMYCDNYYLILPLTTMDYAVEGTTTH